MISKREQAQRSVPRGGGRDALCRALVAVVARDGLDGVTFRSVAREAGVTSGLASYHFGDRDTMVLEALAWAATHSTKIVLKAEEDASLRTFANDLPRLMQKFPGEAMFSFELILAAARRPGLSPAVRGSYDGFISAVQETLGRSGLPSDPTLARVVFAAIDGLSLQYLVYGDAAATREAVEALQQILLAFSRAAGHGHPTCHNEGPAKTT